MHNRGSINLSGRSRRKFETEWYSPERPTVPTGAFRDWDRRRTRCQADRCCDCRCREEGLTVSGVLAESQSSTHTLCRKRRPSSTSRSSGTLSCAAQSPIQQCRSLKKYMPVVSSALTLRPRSREVICEGRTNQDMADDNQSPDPERRSKSSDDGSKETCTCADDGDRADAKPGWRRAGLVAWLTGKRASKGKNVPIQAKASKYWPDAVDDPAGSVNYAVLGIVDPELVAQCVLERAESGVGPWRVRRPRRMG